MQTIYLRLTEELNRLIHTLWFCLIKGPAALMALGVFAALIFSPDRLAAVTVSLATQSLNPEFIIDAVATWFLIGAILVGLNLSHRYLSRQIRGSGARASQQA